MVPLYVPGRAGLLGVRVGGGPPASRPRRELRSARRLEARPGPATAHAHRSQALRPCGGLNTGGTWCADMWLDARPGPAAAHAHRSQAPRPAIVTCHRVLARRHSNVACNSRLAISNFEFISLELQRFQTLLKVHAIELHAILLSAGPAAHGHCGQGAHAVQSSPCSVCWWLERYKVLPAGVKWPKIGVFRCAGRVLYRFDPRGLRTGRVLYRVGPPEPPAGRVLYRVNPPEPPAGRVLSRTWSRMRDNVLPAWFVGGSSGTKFSLLASNGPKSAFFGVLGEFCTGPSNQVRRAGFAKPPEPLRITSLLPTGIGRRDVTSPT